MSAGDAFVGKITGLLYSLHVWGLTHNDPVVSSICLKTFDAVKPAVDDFVRIYQIVGRRRVSAISPSIQSRYSLGYISDVTAEITRQVNILIAEESALVGPLLVISSKINTLAYEIQRTW